MTRLVLVFAAAALASVALAAPAPDAAPADAAPADNADSGMAAGFNVLYNSLAQCERADDIGGCLKLKAIRTLERALQTDGVELVPGVSLERAAAANGAEGGRAASDDVLPFEERALPEDTDARSEVLDDLLADRARRLVESRTLAFSLPRALAAWAGVTAVETGRGKEKRMGPLILMGLLWKGWLGIMAYKGVALLAAKALMTATIALVLAGVLALSKLTHGHEKSHTTVEIVRHPHVTHSYSHSASHEHLDEGVSGGVGGGAGGGAGGWGRSIEEIQRREREQRQISATGGEVQDAQTLAYRAYQPTQTGESAPSYYPQQLQPIEQPVLLPRGEALSVPL